MNTILIIGALLIAAFLCWGLFAGAHMDDDDDEKEFSGLLEDDE